MSEFWPWYLGGGAVAVLAVAYPWVTGRVLGVSSLYARILERNASASAASTSELAQALAAATAEELGEEVQPAAIRQASTLYSRARRLVSASIWFMPGISIGAFLMTVARGDFELLDTLGSAFDVRYGGSLSVEVVLLFFGGVMIGFGTRLAGGCTSGHGISGVALLQRGSLVSTATFWGTGVAVAWVLVRGLGA